MSQSAADEEQAVGRRYRALASVLNERQRRLWAGAEALAAGRGGIATVSRATGLGRPTVYRGIRELEERKEGAAAEGPAAERIRRPGAGRKRLTKSDQTLLTDLQRLVDPVTRGDPESPLRWTCKSTTKLAEELTAQGHPTSPDTVGRLLQELDYSLQAVQKTKEGESHPDRDAQFRHINAEAEAWMAAGQPVISVDAKKKELVGEFRNGGREWQPKGEPEKVEVYDFPSLALGDARPYGVYDPQRNEGWVSVGSDHDTAEFAVATIRLWWKKMGSPAYTEATDLMVTADGGGSNSSRARLWKTELQKLANDTGLNLHVHHFPPGTSKWNKIEHRMFSHISQNWRGRPLATYDTIVNLIASTTTKTGLRIRAKLDPRKYAKGIKVTNQEMNALNIQRSDFHGEWNYTISPLEV